MSTYASEGKVSQMHSRIGSAVRRDSTSRSKYNESMQNNSFQEAVFHLPQAIAENIRSKKETSGKGSRGSTSLHLDASIDTAALNLSSLLKRAPLGRNYRNKPPSRGMGDQPKTLEEVLKCIADENALFHKTLSEMVTKKKHGLITDHLGYNLQLAILLDDMVLLITTLQNMAEVFLSSNQLDSAVFASNHLRLAAELTKNYSAKIDALIKLSDCAKSLRRYPESIKFLKRGLHYAYYTNDIEHELQIYDKMGMIYFYLNEAEKSEFYHKKSNGMYEALDSPLRSLSKLDIDRYHRKHVPYFDHINWVFLSKVDFNPLFFDLPESEAVKRPRKYELLTLLRRAKLNKHLTETEATTYSDKQLRYATSYNAELMIKYLLCEIEFDSEVPSPRSKSNYNSKNQDPNRFLRKKTKLNDSFDPSLSNFREVVRQSYNFGTVRCYSVMEERPATPEKKSLIPRSAKVEGANIKINMKLGKILNFPEFKYKMSHLRGWRQERVHAKGEHSRTQSLQLYARRCSQQILRLSKGLDVSQVVSQS